MPEPIPTNKSAGRRRSAVARPAPRAPAPPARPQPRRPDARAQRDREVARARRLHDAWALGGFAIIAATVLIPWLIGKYLLRDSSFFRQGQGVFDISVRDGGKYFLSDYLSGLLIPGVIVAAFLLLRSWRRRAGLAITGLGLVVSLLIILSVASDKWVANEKQSASALQASKYPYNDNVSYPCFANRDLSAMISGQNVSVGIRESKSSPTALSSHCDVLEVFVGWRKVHELTVPGAIGYNGVPSGNPDGIYFRPNVQNDVARFAGLVTVGATASYTAYLFGFALNQPDATWSRDVKTVNDAGKQVSPRVSLIGDTLAIEEEIDQFRHRLVGASLQTGKTLWTVSCPRGYTTSSFAQGSPNIMTMQCGHGGVGTNGTFQVDASGKVSQVG